MASTSSPTSSESPGPSTWPTGSNSALENEVKLLALSLDERALMLSALEDPPKGLAELRAVLLSDHQWRV